MTNPPPWLAWGIAGICPLRGWAVGKDHAMSGLLGAADQKDHRPQLCCLPPPFHFSMPLFPSLKSREYECVGALRDLRSWKNSSETKVIPVPLGWQLLFPRR